MGAIVRYKCLKCGNKTDDLFIGPGIAVAMQESVICRNCNKIVDRPIDENNEVLPQYRHCDCGEADFAVWNGVCPVCGTKMTFEERGLWD